MATLAQFRTRISAKIGLDNTASSADQSLVDSWVNEGVIDVLRETQCNVATATLSVSSSSGDYTLDSSVLMILDLYTSSSRPDSRKGEPSGPGLFEVRRHG